MLLSLSFQVYELIADHFSDTRHKPWPRVAEFLESRPEGGVVADVGCGNGKYMGINKTLFKVLAHCHFNLILYVLHFCLTSLGCFIVQCHFIMPKECTGNIFLL